MKKFIIKMLCNLIPVKSWRKKFRAKLNRENLFGGLDDIFNEIKIKKETVLNKANTCEVIALGSSHGAYGFNPEFVNENSFNLCSNSQDLYSGYGIFSYLKENLPNLKHLILFIDVFSKGWHLECTNAKHICASYKYLYDIDYPLFEDDQNYLKKCQKIDKIKLNPSKNSNGYLEPPKLTILDTVQQRVDGHMKEHLREISRYIYIYKIADIVKDKGTKMSIVFPPLRKDYSDLLESKLLLKSIEEMNLSKNIKILDFTNDNDFNDDDFYDYDHLNPKGAEKFSKKLKGYLYD